MAMRTKWNVTIRSVTFADVAGPRGPAWVSRPPPVRAISREIRVARFVESSRVKRRVRASRACPSKIFRKEQDDNGRELGT